MTNINVAINQVQLHCIHYTIYNASASFRVNYSLMWISCLDLCIHIFFQHIIRIYKTVKGLFVVCTVYQFPIFKLVTGMIFCKGLL